MKKITVIRRMTILVLALMMFFSSTDGAHALAKQPFIDSYLSWLDENGRVPSANTAENIVDCAKSMVGLRGLDLESEGDWCAAFVSKVAKICEADDAIPYSASVSGLYKNIKAAGGKVIYDSTKGGDISKIKQGDIVIYSINGHSYGHVEIVSKKWNKSKKTVKSIGGNTGSQSHSKAYIQEHSWSKGSLTAVIRPAYQPSSLKYWDLCKKESTWLSGTALREGYAKSLPCSEETNRASENLGKFYPLLSRFTINGIYTNSVGNKWYKVCVDGTDTVGFVYYDYIHINEGIPEGLISGNAKISQEVKRGKSATISGELKAKAKIDKIKAVLTGSKCSEQKVTVSVDGKKLVIKDSKINKSLTTKNLGVGNATLELKASFQLPYVEDNRILYRSYCQKLDPIHFNVVK